jgi:hypothetical protein
MEDKLRTAERTRKQEALTAEKFVDMEKIGRCYPIVFQIDVLHMKLKKLNDEIIEKVLDRAIILHMYIYTPNTEHHCCFKEMKTRISTQLQQDTLKQKVICELEEVNKNFKYYRQELFNNMIVTLSDIKKKTTSKLIQESSSSVEVLRNEIITNYEQSKANLSNTNASLKQKLFIMKASNEAREVVERVQYEKELHYYRNLLQESYKVVENPRAGEERCSNFRRELIECQNELNAKYEKLISLEQQMSKAEASKGQLVSWKVEKMNQITALEKVIGRYDSYGEVNVDELCENLEIYQRQIDKLLDVEMNSHDKIRKEKAFFDKECQLITDKIEEEQKRKQLILKECETLREEMKAVDQKSHQLVIKTKLEQYDKQLLEYKKLLQSYKVMVKQVEGLHLGVDCPRLSDEVLCFNLEVLKAHALMDPTEEQRVTNDRKNDQIRSSTSVEVNRATESGLDLYAQSKSPRRPQTSSVQPMRPDSEAGDFIIHSNAQTPVPQFFRYNNNEINSRLEEIVECSPQGSQLIHEGRKHPIRPQTYYKSGRSRIQQQPKRSQTLTPNSVRRIKCVRAPSAQDSRDPEAVKVARPLQPRSSTPRYITKRNTPPIFYLTNHTSYNSAPSNV